MNDSLKYNFNEPNMNQQISEAKDDSIDKISSFEIFEMLIISYS